MHKYIEISPHVTPWLTAKRFCLIYPPIKIQINFRYLDRVKTDEKQPIENKALCIAKMHEI